MLSNKQKWSSWNYELKSYNLSPNYTNFFSSNSICSSDYLQILEINGLCFPGGSVGKESVCNAVDLGLIPGLRRFPRGGYDNPSIKMCAKSLSHV